MNMAKKERVTLSLSPDLIEKLDERRGLTKRSTFTEDLLRRVLLEEVAEPSRPIARSVR
jgi:metal-responsive CopG/Arc/MetJ family transcriptional regulator